MSALLIHAARRRNPQLLMQPEQQRPVPLRAFAPGTTVAEATRQMRARGYALELRRGGFFATRIH